MIGYRNKMLKYDRTLAICKTKPKTKNLISQLLCCSQIPTAIAQAVNKSLIQSLTHRKQHRDQVSATGSRDLHKNVTVGLFLVLVLAERRDGQRYRVARINTCY